MELTTLEQPSRESEIPITSIQPGGGFCVDWERRWGRARRAWLRAFRRGYVARMAALRQGACEGCTHDVVDARDLKLYRNVCGYWFRHEDDPFRWRERLGLARAGLAEVAITSLVCGLAFTAFTAAAVATGRWGWWIPAAAVLVPWYQGVRFFRDPERQSPQEPGALLSPTDGVVTHVHAVRDPQFPGERALRISVYLSPWDVHLNRNPCDGTVEAVRYFLGEFVRARREDCAARNEQLWVDYRDRAGRLIRVKQISGAMARRIVCWLKPTDAVTAGERYGMIKYGSRGDVLISAAEAVEVAVAVGDVVRAGETIMLRFTGEEGA